MVIFLFVDSENVQKFVADKIIAVLGIKKEYFQHAIDLLVDFGIIEKNLDSNNSLFYSMHPLTRKVLIRLNLPSKLEKIRYYHIALGAIDDLFQYETYKTKNEGSEQYIQLLRHVRSVLESAEQLSQLSNTHTEESVTIEYQCETIRSNKSNLNQCLNNWCSEKPDSGYANFLLIYVEDEKRSNI